MVYLNGKQLHKYKYLFIYLLHLLVSLKKHNVQHVKRTNNPLHYRRYKKETMQVLAKLSSIKFQSENLHPFASKKIENMRNTDDKICENSALDS